MGAALHDETLALAGSGMPMHKGEHGLHARRLIPPAGPPGATREIVSPAAQNAGRGTDGSGGSQPPAALPPRVGFRRTIPSNLST
jgi:hypothetical protein